MLRECDRASGGRGLRRDALPAAGTCPHVGVILLGLGTVIPPGFRRRRRLFDVCGRRVVRGRIVVRRRIVVRGIVVGRVVPRTAKEERRTDKHLVAAVKLAATTMKLAAAMEVAAPMEAVAAPME